MLTNRDIRLIHRKLIDCAVFKLHWLEGELKDMLSGQKLPLFVCVARIAETDQELEEDKFNITVKIAEPLPDRNKLSDKQYQDLLDDRRSEFTQAIKELVIILSGTEFDFPFSLNGVIEFEDFGTIEEGITDWDLYGTEATYSLTARFRQDQCCDSFDHEQVGKIKWNDL